MLRVESYSLRRKWIYEKNLKGSQIVSKSCSLLKKVGDDWGNPIPYPEELIEKILPKGLSEYYFFAGESIGFCFKSNSAFNKLFGNLHTFHIL